MDNPMLEFRHWVGWSILSAIITGSLFFTKVIMDNAILMTWIVLVGLIAIVDTFNHCAELQ